MTEVTQADLDAAEAFFPKHHWRDEARADVAQAFAQHRINTRPASTEAVDALAALLPMSTAPRDGTEVLLYAHDMFVQARFCPGEWSEDTPISPAEYSGAVWSCFDDEFQIEVEELPDGEYGDHPATGWLPLPLTHTDAMDRDYTKRRIKELTDEGDGFWRPCSGCQENNDGYVSTKDYPYSDTFQCQPGSGCGECGGIGVIWDDTNREAYAKFALTRTDALAEARDVLTEAHSYLDVAAGAGHICQGIDAADLFHKVDAALSRLNAQGEKP